ncbi:MAG: DUF3943 domain-containing protein [Muribaculaceae bacterium]|nr:DUF3943 domain-containing protein [Muribaculaceae bacterium]
MKAKIKREDLHRLLIVAFIAIGWMAPAGATITDRATRPSYTCADALGALTHDMAVARVDPDTLRIVAPALPASFRPVINIYDMPYSVAKSYPDWHRLWINTATLCGAYLATFGVLQLLPEDATSWNRREITSVPPLKRWWRNVYRLGPEWDHDNAVFNYILHPYAGAVYYMSARSCGFNVGQSLLYCTCISTIAWEYGIEAFMERPSIQDIFITPLVGSLIGECFYKVKRHIVSNGYRLAGSPVLGNIVVFLCDPVNEVVGLFAGNPCRRGISGASSGMPEISSSPWMRSDPVGGMTYGFTVSCRF